MLCVRRLPIVAVVLAPLIVTATRAQTSRVGELRVSFDQAIVVSGPLAADQQIVVDDFGEGPTMRDLGLPEEVDLDAYHQLSNGDELFSIDVSAVLGGSLYVRPGDVVLASGGSLTKVWDAAAFGVETNTDAISFDEASSTLYLSFDNDIPGPFGLLHSHDVLSWDLTTSTFGLLFAGCPNRVPTGADVDAIHWDPVGGRLLLSFDVSTAAGAPIAADDEDVVSWEEVWGWTLDVDLSAVRPGTSALDIDALWAATVSSGLIFRDNFETGSLAAWTSSSP